MKQRLLLDTCIVYDWLLGEIKNLSAIQLIRSEGALVSPVSVWEMAIKNALGKMPLPTTAIAEDIEAQGFQWLNITAYHAQTLLDLGAHHKDPFDRWLIAQGQFEACRIVTYDAVFQRYLNDVWLIDK